MPKFLKQEDGSLEHRRNTGGGGGGSWAGASWAFVPFMGGQHAKVPRTWGWLLGAITQKGRRGKPGGPPFMGAQHAKVPRTRGRLSGEANQGVFQGDGPSPLGRAGPAGPFTGGGSWRPSHKSLHSEWGVSHGEPGGGHPQLGLPIPPGPGHPPWARGGPAGPFMGSQRVKVPQMRGWLLGTITQKGRSREPEGPRGMACPPWGGLDLLVL